MLLSLKDAVSNYFYERNKMKQKQRALAGEKMNQYIATQAGNDGGDEDEVEAD